MTLSEQLEDLSNPRTPPMKIEALKELEAKVGAGTDIANDHANVFPSESAYGRCTWHLSHRASTAGSLDAARDLHEAVLPGWSYALGSHAPRAVISPNWPETGKGEYAGSATPARAWLLAIIRALIAQEQSTGKE